MTMLSRWESVVEAQIRMAQERGDFDNLPGKGKPVPGLTDPDDELWWVKGFIRREGLPTDALLPTSLRLRKEVEQLPETVRGLSSEQAVRAVVTDLNARITAWIRTPSGPPVPLRPVDLDDVLREWRATRAGRRVPDERLSSTDRVVDEPSAQPETRPWWRRLGGRGGRH